MLLGFALAAVVSTLAPDAGSMSFADLVRFSDVIVVASVESEAEVPIAEDFELEFRRPGGVATLGTLRVERWIKGQPTDSAPLFLNQSTWTCDITGADVGERAVFFLCGDKGDPLRDAIPCYTETFGDRPLLRVVHSGRGQMDLRSVEGEELATCWAGDVVLPEDAPRRPGPDPRYTFKQSIPLAWLSSAIPAIAAAQHRTLFRLEADEGVRPGLPWTLTIREDRSATLVVDPKGGADSSELRIDTSAARAMDRALDRGELRAAHEVGTSERGAWDRRLIVMTPEGEHEVRLGALGGLAGDERARLAATLWRTARDVLGPSEAIDHRDVDAQLE